MRRAANALQKSDFEQQGKTYDPEAHRAFVDRLLNAFDRDHFARVRGFGLPTRRPVFVVGLPRSGTTLVEQVLSSHHRVFGAGELRLVHDVFEELPEVCGRQATALDCLSQLDSDVVRSLATRHDGALSSMGFGADRVVDKMPENTLYLGWIATLFPQAIVICCHRDLRDVALSCWLTHLAQVRWACDLDHIASRIGEHARLMKHWRSVLPTPILEINYELLVAEPDHQIRQLVHWCGLEWDPACLNFHKQERPVRTASAAQVRRPVHRRSVGRWKNYESWLGSFFERIDPGPGSLAASR